MFRDWYQRLKTLFHIARLPCLTQLVRKGGIGVKRCFLSGNKVKLSEKFLAEAQFSVVSRSIQRQIIPENIKNVYDNFNNLPKYFCQLN